jgi:hypothetical protein
MLILVKMSERKIAPVRSGWEDNINIKRILKDREYECAK